MRLFKLLLRFYPAGFRAEYGPELFPMLGVAPAAGRLFTAEDDREGAPGTVLLSHGLWKRLFGGSSEVLGRNLRFDEETYVVIGIMPQGFYFPDHTAQFWTPLRLPAQSYEDRDDNWLQVIAKRKTDRTLEQARAEMKVITEGLERQFPVENAETRATVIPLRDEVSQQARLLLMVLFAASTSLLLIACMNLANLLLARALNRRRELTVRIAIGAGRERLFRQLLTESLLLSFLGGGLGLTIAVQALPLMARLVPGSLPFGDASVLDLRVLTFSAALTCLSGVGFGVLPALRVGSGGDTSGLREGARSGMGGRSERLRSSLVIAEITASVVLLVSSGLLIRALWRVQSVDPGFRTEGVLTLRTALPMTKYAATARRVSLYTQVLSEVRALPGVSDAAYISFLPMVMRGGIWPVVAEGAPAEQGPQRSASLRFVTPGFFETLSIPIRMGRDVSDSDTRENFPVAVVSESFVRKYWPDKNPLGRRIQFAFQERTVVGVVGDIRFRGLEATSEPQVYLSYQQVPDGTFPFYAPKDLVIRSTSEPEPLAAAVRRIVQTADPEQPVFDVRPLADIVDADTAPRQTQVRVLGVFAAVAFLLAGVGIYGLLSFSVSQRTAEIGLRLAIGATRSRILASVLRKGILLAAIGSVMGAALAYAAGRSMEALLAGVKPSDTATFLIACGPALSMTLLGSLLPALRATRVDPVTALRVE